MALYREINFNEGTLLDRFGAVPTANTAELYQTEKGMGLNITASKATTYNQTLLPTGAFSVVIWCKVINHPTSAGGRINAISNGGFENALSPKFSSGNIATLYLGANNSRAFNNSVWQDSKYHCYIYTIPGSSQTSINDSKLFIDTIEQSVNATTATSAQSSRSIYTIVGTGNANALEKNNYIAKIRVYDHVLSTQEINQEQVEFENAQPINKAKRGFVLNKPTDLYGQVGSGANQGLLGAYNMVKNGSTMVDISGNGRTATLPSTVVSTEKGLLYASNSTTSISGTMTPLGTGNYTFSFRCKPILDGLTVDSGIIASASLGITVYTRRQNGTFAVGKVGVNDLTAGSDNTFRNGIEATYSLVRTGTTINTYRDGVLLATNTDANDYTVGINGILSRGTTVTGFRGEMIDLRVYNRAWSVQEIQEYHNSFVKPSVLDDFSDAGADNIVKSTVPLEWERISGSWKVDANVVSTRELIVGGPNFSTNVGWSLSGATISGGIFTGTTSGLQYCTSTVTLALGKRYRIEVNILTSTVASAKVYVGGLQTSVLPTGRSVVFIDMTTLSNQLVGFNDLVGTSNYLSITEVPQLETMQNGTKFLECTSNGMISIPCNTAYGAWEWDWYMGSGGESGICFINGSAPVASFFNPDGYSLAVRTNSLLNFFVNTGVVSAGLFTVARQTWYRVRITRSVSGVFNFLMKGGSLVPTAGQNGWTTVFTSQTNTTYNVSGNILLDYDTGSRFANLVVRNGIRQ